MVSALTVYVASSMSQCPNLSHSSQANSRCSKVPQPSWSLLVILEYFCNLLLSTWYHIHLSNNESHHDHQLLLQISRSQLLCYGFVYHYQWGWYYDSSTNERTKSQRKWLAKLAQSRQDLNQNLLTTSFMLLMTLLHRFPYACILMSHTSSHLLAGRLKNTLLSYITSMK